MQVKVGRRTGGDSLGEVELGEAVQTTHRLGNTLQLVVIQEKHFQRIPQNHGKLYGTHCQEGQSMNAQTHTASHQTQFIRM